jgi:cell division protein FtsB
LPAGRLARLGATPAFHHGLLGCGTRADDGSVVAGGGTVLALVSFERAAPFLRRWLQNGAPHVAANVCRQVEKLEERVTALEELPARIDDLTSQVLQLRQEMRGEFSAVRTAMRELNDETKRHMLVLHEAIIARLTLIQESANGKKRPGTKGSRRT